MMLITNADAMPLELARNHTTEPHEPVTPCQLDLGKDSISTNLDSLFLTLAHLVAGN